jgi:hypothetical protein
MNQFRTASWLLLVASLPTSSATARMRIWRAIKALGCAPMRDGAYLLPAGPPGHKDALAALADETIQEGGQAWLVDVAPRSADQEVAFKALFDRSDDHSAFFNDLTSARMALAGQLPVEVNRTLRKLGRDHEALIATDFFPTEASLRTQSVWADFQEAANAVLSPGEPHGDDGPIRRCALADYQGRTWATRRNMWVDRIASAWLIRRFIDPQARFIWLAKPKDCPKEALGFDFDGASFTHVGDKVTFEVLLASFGLAGDSGLQRLAAMVHALDVGGTPVPEAMGFEAILKGASQRLQDDDALLHEIGSVLDSLHAHFQQEAVA